MVLDDQINRDPVSSEMLKMRQQLEYLQAKLSARDGGVSFDELRVSASLSSFFFFFFFF